MLNADDRRFFRCHGLSSFESAAEIFMFPATFGTRWRGRAPRPIGTSSRMAARFPPMCFNTSCSFSEKTRDRSSSIPLAGFMTRSTNGSVEVIWVATGPRGDAPIGSWPRICSGCAAFKESAEPEQPPSRHFIGAPSASTVRDPSSSPRGRNRFPGSSAGARSRGPSSRSPAWGDIRRHR